MTRPRILSYKHFLEERFGTPVRKISLNAGFSCPTRDGSRGTSGCFYCNNDTFHHSRRATDPLSRLRNGASRLAQQKPGTSAIAYFQAYTNTYGPVDALEDLYRSALAVDHVVGLAIATRPDCISEPLADLLEELAKSAYIQVELGLQSASAHTLESIGRGHGVAEFFSATKCLSGRGLALGGHMILGLPGETQVDWQHTADVLVQTGCQLIKIHNFHVVRNSVFGEQWIEGKPFLLQDLTSYVEALAEVVMRLPRSVFLERLYAIAPKKQLLGPSWAVDANRIVSEMDRCFREKDVWQGKLWKEPAPPEDIKGGGA